MTHANMSNNLDELRRIAKALRKRFEESKTKTETLERELQAVEQKIQSMEATS